ncbi:MAG TPA: radical SAM protein [Ktedonobacteraceae bacterium]
MLDGEQRFENDTSFNRRRGCGLDLVYFGLFDNCNVRCNMCACWQLPRSRLDPAHYQRVLQAVLSLQPAALRFTGGEPLLLPRLPELVSMAARAGVRVSLISNGLLLAKRVAGLALAGCAEIVLSLDAIGERHDRIRQTPGLFARCLEGMAATQAAGLSYGINTVCQTQGIDDLPALADLLLSRSKRPAWWHLIPVRGQSTLVPDQARVQKLRQILPDLRQRLAAQGVVLIADAQMFAHSGPCPCRVPTFTAYVRADSGEVYGCNMLAYAAEPIGNLLSTPAHTLWQGQAAREQRMRCARGSNSACERCDASSQAMNYHLQQFARAFAHPRDSSSDPALEGGCDVSTR